MRSSLILPSLFCVIITILAGPVPDVEVATLPSSKSLQLRAERCARVNKLKEKPTIQDWVNDDIDGKFRSWLNKHPEKPFDKAWGEWAFGDPDWSCGENDANDCDLPDCDNEIMAEKSDDDLKMAYYVTKSLVGLRSYFVGMIDSMDEAAIYSALTKDDWARDFYKVDSHKSVDAAVLGIAITGILLAMALTFINPVFASFGILGTAPAGLGLATAAAVGTVGMLVNTIPGALGPVVTNPPPKPLDAQNQADVGAELGRIFQEIKVFLRHANDELFAGSGTTNAKSLGVSLPGFIQLGAFLNYRFDEKDEVVKSMTAWMQGHAINEMWRNQKVFIVGGGSCEDDDGFGTGPQEAKLCRDDQAWYLYHWEEKDKLGGKKKAAGLMAPHGMELLGTKDYPDITPQDIISSSLDTHLKNGLDYNRQDLEQSLKEATEKGDRNVFEHSARWEGLFTIPVCDISIRAATRQAEGSIPHENQILQPYGPKNDLTWCGAICDNDMATTLAFLEAAGWGVDQDDDYFTDRCSVGGAADPIEDNW